MAARHRRVHNGRAGRAAPSEFESRRLGTVQTEAAMKKCSLVALVIPGVPFLAAAGAQGGLLVRK
jgi:hypothetical protein